MVQLEVRHKDSVVWVWQVERNPVVSTPCITRVAVVALCFPRLPPCRAISDQRDLYAQASLNCGIPPLSRWLLIAYHDQRVRLTYLCLSW